MGPGLVLFAQSARRAAALGAGKRGRAEDRRDRCVLPSCRVGFYVNEHVALTEYHNRATMTVACARFDGVFC
jgi:hypothetical protein